MGCGGSKLQEEAAVALCRQRSQLLAEAIRYRYALADAHAAYARSLQSVAVALHEFLYGTRPPPPASPVLPLPAQRKGYPVPLFTPAPLPPVAAASVAVFLPSAAVRGHSQSHSGSHINFHPSDSDADDISPFHSDGGSPLHHLPADDSPAIGQTYVNLNYAKKGPMPSSVTHELQPPNSEPVSFGSVDEPAPVAYPYYGYPYPPQNSNFYPSYPSDQSYMNYGDGMSGGFFGFSSPLPNIPPPTIEASGRPTSREPPPPPPSTASTLDFLNPFESFDNYFAPYSPRRSSRELREEEGIPDLENEDPEVVKEAFADPKYTASTSAAANGANGTYSGKTARRSKEVEINSADNASQRKAKPVEAGSSSEHEVHVIEKRVVAEPAEWRSARFTVSQNYQNDSEIVQEIKTQFDRVSQSVEQASKMLEVGKTLYQKKDSSYKVSVRMICGLSLTSANADLSCEEDDSLSSTLQKLYSWEQKLLEEVMVEEEMRVQYERKHQYLRYLRERGVEAEKLEAVETSIRKLSTKIRISIQVVGTISNKINQLRDGELWLRVCEIISGFEEMWRVMSECHHIQHQAISKAKNLDSFVPGGKLPDALYTIKHLELVMAEWIANFSVWVTAQKMYVNALNGWLKKGIAYEPEVTDDGEVPFSPGRLGAPPVFVICNYWSSSIDMVSEMEIIKAAHLFLDNVLNIWKEHKAVHQQRQLTDKDKNSKLRSIEMEEQELLKQRKKLLIISSENRMPTIEHEDHGSTVISFQSSLRHIFQVVENFSANAMKLYEVLNKQTEEEKQRLAGEDARGS